MSFSSVNPTSPDPEMSKSGSDRDDSNVDAIQIPQSRAYKIKLWLAIASLIFQWVASMGTFLCIAPIIDLINQDIGPRSSTAWVASAYTVVSGVSLIVAGTLSDLVGRRWFAVASSTAPMIAGIIGGTAQNMSAVIASTAILGINGGLVLNVFPCISELVPKKSRGYVFGILNAAAIFWVMCGSLIGHEMAIHSSVGWRGLFYMTIALNGAATLFTLLVYFPDKPLATRNMSKMEIVRDFDRVGLLGLMVGPTLFFMGIIWINDNSPTSPKFLAPFLIGIVSMIALGFYEVYWAKNPILHPVLFRQMRTFTMLIVMTFVGGMLFYSLISFFPIYLSALSMALTDAKRELMAFRLEPEQTSGALAPPSCCL
ncbi:hypothetical protein Z517_06824 [Fonsecaea pedrosoi CBS 271.37]|uniref:Major facilitator superfamily (MFS) profile domain-containing protein n=1 Tax=Fonsecaea pedrosoi CBS 271.37 TaxID=1442368 RepID=A0A0D2H6C4_9EURO|nr:uncharacterized protein Z517_06824 [Fonsecaea pedrosoi CBS 271.37]KIW80209.1 hypothetical protein Z517_06824 [Fonsecaea pedrosoi CBS 271.37]